MSPFGVLNEVWFIELHGGIVGSLSLILAIKITFVQTQEFRELRDVLHKPSLKRKKKELREVRGGLVEPEV